MKPFDIELAKAGHPVQTRDGRPVRIICFDRKHPDKHIVALITYGEVEDQYFYPDNGLFVGSWDTHCLDILMAPTKKEGWINIYPKERYVNHISNAYETEEEALKRRKDDCLATIKIEWEE